MQNGFNDRIAILISLLLVFCLLSCRTSKKSIEKSRIEIEKKEVKINKVDSSVLVQKNNTFNKVDSLSWFNSIKNYDISYLGTSSDDFGTIEQTLSGWKFTGKVKVNLKGIEEKGDSVKTSNTHQINNEQSKINSNLEFELKSNDSQIKVDKEKDKFSISPTFGVLVGLIILFIVYLVYEYFKKK